MKRFGTSAKSILISFSSGMVPLLLQEKIILDSKIFTSTPTLSQQLLIVIRRLVAVQHPKFILWWLMVHGKWNTWKVVWEIKRKTG
jgi:hypothetical protein